MNLTRLRAMIKIEVHDKDGRLLSSSQADIPTAQTPPGVPMAAARVEANKAPAAPSLWKKLVGIATGWKNLLLGKEKELSERRMEICRKCENYVGGKCKICGCILIAKTQDPKQHCPLGEDVKW